MSLAPSETLAMSQKSNELKAQGVDVINLSVGEPDFNTPDHIKAAAKKAIDDNFSFYSPVPGYLDLRKAICGKLKNENGLDFTPEQIVVSNGAKQAICNAVLCIVNPGDEVIIPAPCWVSYVEMVKLAEGKSVVVPAGIEQDFKITPAQLEAAITPKTKAIILCSPSNPTGSVYSRDELKALADVLAKHPQIIIIADEIYEHINYAGGHQSIAQFENVRDRVAIINGVSKALQQVAEPIYVGPELHCPESLGGSLCRRPALRGGDAAGFRAPPQSRGGAGAPNTRIQSQCTARSLLPFPRRVVLLRKEIRRPHDQRLCRFGNVSARRRACGYGGRRRFLRSRVPALLVCHFR